MADVELQEIFKQSSKESTDPWGQPGASTLQYLSSLDLSDDDLELLLGEAPGLSWSDMKQDAQAFYFRLRSRTANLVCHDNDLKDAVSEAVKGGAEAAWVALVAAVGLNPDTLVAAALKPIAVAIVLSGVKELCRSH